MVSRLNVIGLFAIGNINFLRQNVESRDRRRSNARVPNTLSLYLWFGASLALCADGCEPPRVRHLELQEVHSRNRDCPGCEALYVIWLHTGIAQKKAEQGEGLLRSYPVRTAEDHPANHAEPGDESGSQEEAETVVEQPHSPRIS